MRDSLVPFICICVCVVSQLNTLTNYSENSLDGTRHFAKRKVPSASSVIRREVHSDLVIRTWDHIQSQHNAHKGQQFKTFR